MPKWRERTCTSCQSVMLTASKSEICIACCGKNKALGAVDKEKQIIEDYGYVIVGEPTKNNFGKRVYTLIAPCCNSECSTVFGNLITGIKKNEQSGYNKLPCGVCGPKHRMQTALTGYVERNGKDYDIKRANHYVQLVRKLSEHTYRANRELINPDNHIRGLNHSYHLDHIVPIIECFKRGWTPEQAAVISNLQMLHWKDNLTKGSNA